jgi:PilZ domain
MRNLSIVNSRYQRRSAVRYRLSLPVIFHWTDGGEFTEGGFTYDIALDGALICSTQCPPVGSAVRIEVLIPSPDQSSEPLRIQCTGTVTRIVSEGDRSSFGVSGSFSDDNIVSQIYPSADGSNTRGQ